jgi:hypothetical protein
MAMKYKIMMRERWTFLNSRGNPVDGYRITFMLEDGTVDWVDIPEKQFNPDAVEQAIQEKIIRHEAVLGLGEEII